MTGDQFGPGLSAPLGATPRPDGTNFSVYSRSATGVSLLLFRDASDPAPARVITFDPVRNRSGSYWHVFAPGVGPGQVYGFRVAGPSIPEAGLRFNPDKVLLDPYSRAVAVPRGYTRLAATRRGDNAATAMKSVVADLSGYDWEGDAPLRRPLDRTIIYEMHVGGFTRHPSSGVRPERRGTYAGLVEKIPYLVDLGVTAVELLPVFQFDAQDASPGHVNYWGYCPVSFFAPHAGYCVSRDPLAALDEFRDMVKALHRAGLEVILDVVFNHTAEGSHLGPTLCFRGFENPTYYMLQPDRSRYANYSGTGNTLNGNHPVVRRLIRDSLHHWVRTMHVDGFRFDLASILARDENGHPLENPPVLWDIDTDPALAGSKLIAEAWDAGGLYQVGSFVGDRWTEWNGRFRDDIRSFVRGDSGMVTRMPDRLLGSPDLYAPGARGPEKSINFVTCHDGFTLNDLVSYNTKHNEDNGEENRDGADDNRSWNGGLEGPSDDPAVEAVRNRQVKNFLTLTLIAIGTPMLLMGDEVRRTQRGNNNAYCQDDEMSWFDWSGVTRHADVHRFTRLLIAARQRLSVNPGESLNQLLHASRLEWHGVHLGHPDWGHDSHSLALTVVAADGARRSHLMLNAYWEPLEFELPAGPAGSPAIWYRWIDTGLPSPDDIADPGQTPELAAARYTVGPRSIVILFSDERTGRQ